MEKADGLKRVSRIENDNRSGKGGRSPAAAAKKLGPLASPRHNPTKGGGINRALKGQG